jgi:SAM-dependent methyltransferase
MPVPEDLGKLYERYHTHTDLAVVDSRGRRLFRGLVEAYLHSRYGYFRDRSWAWPPWLGRLLHLHPGRRSIADGLVMGLAARAGGRLLEVGCGSGDSLKLLQELGWDAEGIDFDPQAVANARAKGLRVRQGDLAGQAFPSASFDAVIASHVIEHVPDPEALLVEAHRVLRPGGALVLYTPNAASLGRHHFREDWRGLEPPRHLHVFTPEALTALTRRAGFADATWEAPERGSVILLASRNLRKHGRIVPDAHTWGERLLREGSFYLEALICLVRPRAGEEIRLRAQRRASPDPGRA